MIGLVRLNLVLALAIVGSLLHTASQAEGQLAAWIGQAVSAELGVEVVVMERRTMPEPRWPVGASLRLRYPSGSGQHLPSALEAWQSGRLLVSLPLGSYIDFRLAVASCRSSQPRGAQLTMADMLLSEQTLAPGSEILTDPQRACGLMVRSYLPAGERVKLSRLTTPPAVRVGSEVPLLLRSTGIELSVLGTALADAYVGQPVSVRRLSDRRTFRGVVQELESGVVVVVE